MRINKVGKAGTLESNDILIMVIPSENEGVEIELQSIVIKQYGEEIRRVLLNKAQELQMENVIIKAQDKGALNYTIEARLETAFERAK